MRKFRLTNLNQDIRVQVHSICSSHRMDNQDALHHNASLVRILPSGLAFGFKRSCAGDFFSISTRNAASEWRCGRCSNHRQRRNNACSRIHNDKMQWEDNTSSRQLNANGDFTTHFPNSPAGSSTIMAPANKGIYTITVRALNINGVVTSTKQIDITVP